MGACLSSTDNEEFRGSVVLSSILDRERKDAASQYVILFLGTGESGKSTFFKQLKIIHGGGIDKGDRAAIRSCIRTMIISDVMILIRGCLLPNMAGLIGQDVKVSQDIIDMLCGAELSPQTVKQAIIGASPDDNYLSPMAGDLIHAIWNDPIVKKVGRSEVVHRCVRTHADQWERRSTTTGACSISATTCRTSSTRSRRSPLPTGSPPRTTAFTRDKRRLASSNRCWWTRRLRPV